MFPELATAMGADPANPPVGRAVLLRDSSADPDAGFMVHHFIGLHLRAGHTVVVCSFSQALFHYSFVARKLGCPLDNKLHFVDCISNLLATSDANDVVIASPATKRKGTAGPVMHRYKLSNADAPLDALFEVIAGCIEADITGPGEPRCCVVLDDIGVLTDLGLPAAQVLDFVARLRALVCRADGREPLGTIVTLCHADPEDFADPEDRDQVDATWPPLSQHLACISDVVLDVRGLASGYSKDVHGQLTIRTMATILAPCMTSQDLQFKTRDNGVSFFAPGTSAAVL